MPGTGRTSCKNARVDVVRGVDARFCFFLGNRGRKSETRPFREKAASIGLPDDYGQTEPKNLCSSCPCVSVDFIHHRANTVTRRIIFQTPHSHRMKLILDFRRRIGALEFHVIELSARVFRRQWRDRFILRGANVTVRASSLLVSYLRTCMGHRFGRQL